MAFGSTATSPWGTSLCPLVHNPAIMAAMTILLLHQDRGAWLARKHKHLWEDVGWGQKYHQSCLFNTKKPNKNKVTQLPGSLLPSPSPSHKYSTKSPHANKPWPPDKETQPLNGHQVPILGCNSAGVEQAGSAVLSVHSPQPGQPGLIPSSSPSMAPLFRAGSSAAMARAACLAP